MSKPKNPATPAPGLSAAMAEILEDALAIQDRFEPEPMLKTTGRGVLKSRGAEGLQKDAEELQRKLGRAARHKS